MNRTTRPVESMTLKRYSSLNDLSGVIKVQGVRDARNVSWATGRVGGMEKELFVSIPETVLIDDGNENEDGDEYDEQEDYIRHLKLCGYTLIITAWVLFVGSMGTIFNLWEWCLGENFGLGMHLESIPWIKIMLESIHDQNNGVVDHYYILVFTLNFVILWVWAVASWISMKLFRHSKGGGS